MGDKRIYVVPERMDRGNLIQGIRSPGTIRNGLEGGVYMLQGVAVKPEVLSFSNAKEVRTFEKGRIEFLNVEGRTIGRITFEPGWKWSVNMKPIVNTELCEMSHLLYQISGRMRIRMADGSEFDFGPGMVVNLPAGHDGWVVGNEPSVAIDLEGSMIKYALGE
jgi:hypothetical protein